MASHGWRQYDGHLFPRAALMKYQKLGGLKQQKCVVFQFWRLEILNQVVIRAMLCLMALGENLPLSLLVLLCFLAIPGIPWFINASLQSHDFFFLYLHSFFSLCGYMPKFPLFVRTPIILYQGLL